MRKYSRAEALKIIKAHGWLPSSPTVIDCDGNWVPDSSFDNEVGVKDEYTAKELEDWLGY